MILLRSLFIILRFFRCLKKAGHSGLHKAIYSNKFGVFQGLWDDKKIVLNWTEPEAKIGVARRDAVKRQHFV